MIRAWEMKELRKEYERWLIESDVVIGFPDDWRYLKERLSMGKFCLPATERPLKPSSPLWGWPPAHRNKTWLRHVLSYYRGKAQQIRRWREIDSPYCHALAIGAYSPWDLQRLGVFKGRMWTYGYFTEVPSTPPVQRTGEPVEILWAGRMLDWKRVDVLIRACGILKESGWDFHLTLIGDGPEKASLERLVVELGLQSVVSMLPPVSPQEVRRAMRSAYIYVLPSTQEEGWSAVIGEAMAEGCAVISTRGAGAAPLLIQPGKTGYLFPVDDIESLAGYLRGVGE